MKPSEKAMAMMKWEVNLVELKERRTDLMQELIQIQETIIQTMQLMENARNAKD